MVNLNAFQKHKNLLLIVLLTLAVLLRVAYVLHIYSTYGITKWVDGHGYLNYGLNIAQGNWAAFDQSVRGPVIPFLVAFFTLLFGNPIIPFLIYNALITGLMVAVLFYLGKELFNETTAWLSAIWGVFFMEAFNYSTQILKEPTLFFLFPLTILFLIRSIKSGKPYLNIFWASITFALLIHTDERFLIYFPFFMLFFLLKKPFKTPVFIRQTTIWVIMAFILMLPWNIRNYQVFDQIVILSPMTTAFTSKLWGSDIKQLGNKLIGLRDDVQQENTEIRIPDRARKFGEEHGIVPRKLSKNEARFKSFLHFWQVLAFKPFFIQDGFRPHQFSTIRNVTNLLFYGIFLPFYFFSFYWFIKRKHYSGLLVASIPLIHSFLHAYMVWTLVRYRAPVLFIVAIVGIYIISEILRNKSSLFRKPKSLSRKTSFDLNG
jgi:4-amino-4-deoxy-L-arabinose transferase-like glycosyltransferase